MQNLGKFRGVVKSVRQITTRDTDNKVSSNLEVTFKVVTKKVTDEEGKITWVECSIPSIKKDGTLYESKTLALSNRCLLDIDYMSDPKLSTAAKKTITKLFAKHSNPMKVFSNVGELFTYILKDRGIEFDRDKFDVGEKIVSENGTSFEVVNVPVMQTNIDNIVGNIIAIYDELVCEWVGEEHPQPQQTQQPQQQTPQSATEETSAMWANV